MQLSLQIYSAIIRVILKNHSFPLRKQSLILIRIEIISKCKFRTVVSRWSSQKGLAYSIEASYFMM
jgi:hypothetical protein